MSDKTDKQVDENPPLIEFPCQFEIKVMGIADDDFQDKMVSVIQSHVADFSANHITQRYSSSGKYISLTCQLWVISQVQLDAIYIDVSQHPLVKYAI